MVDESIAKLNRSKDADARRKYVLVAVLCVASLAASYWARLRGVVMPQPIFLPLHIIIEFSSIIVSFAVFVTGWFGYRQSGDTRDLFLGTVFLSTGILDFAHTFTYQGMPDFFGPSGVQKATTFWTIARLWTAFGLVCACFIKPSARNRLLSPPVLFACALLASCVVIWAVVHQYPQIGGLFYDLRNRRLTDVKLLAEYAVIALYAATFVLCSRKRGWDEDKVVPLRCALIVAVAAEIAFTMYNSPFAWMNFLGHILKTWAYLLILAALFVSSLRRPYQELSVAKEELEVLYEDAKDHRVEIEQSFARIGSALSSSIRLDEALGQIADLAIGMLHADCAVVVSLPRGAGNRQISAQRGDTHVPGRAIEVTVETGKKAIEQGISGIVNNNLRDSGWIACDYASHNCLRSMACAPVYFEGDALGMIAVYGHQFEAFDEGDQKLLEAFASHAAVAIHNAMIYERESRIADVLQRTFVSPSQLVHKSFDIAQVYASAMEEAQVGGDFYDVIDLGCDRVGLVIGDVSGKGLAAAVHTAMAKYGLRAYLSEGHSPAKALDLLNGTITESTSIETFITLFCGVLDTSTGAMVYASGGHEPALLCTGESYSTLDSTGPAVGLGIDVGYQDVSVTLQPGNVLLMYTDGVTEARLGRSFFGTERLGETLVSCREGNSEQIAKCVHQAAIDFSEGGIKDDIAILVVKAAG